MSDIRAEIAAGWEEQRRLAGIAGLWRACPRAACRRSRACRTATTPCITERREEFRAAFERIFESPLLDELQDAE